MDNDTRTVVVSSSSETLDVLAGALRFGKSLRNRKGVMTTYLLVALSAGAAYFVTADRVYQSDGELMVLPTGANVLDTNRAQPQVSDRDMPSYERMVTSDPVIRATIKSLPREHHRDLLGVPPGIWEKAFRQRVSVSVTRDTNFLSVSYRSSDPETAYAVLSTLFTQYVTYVNSVYERDIDDRLKILRAQQKIIDDTIREKEIIYSQLLNNSSMLLVNRDEQTNIYYQQVKDLNASLTEARQRHTDARVQLEALELAIAKGEDLQQFYMRMAEHVGTEIFKKQVGVSSYDGYTVARLTEKLIEDQNELQNKTQNLNYGENHPSVRKLRDNIRIKEQFLRDLPLKAREAADAATQVELAPRLVQMARQEFEIAVQLEREIQQQFDEANAKAESLNSQMVEFRQVENELDALRKNREEFLSTMQKAVLDQQHGLFTEISRDPQIMTTPVAPKLTLVVVVSLFLGFSSACLTIYVLDLLDDRFHTPDDLRTQVGAPILAMVRRLPQLGGQGINTLHTYTRPNSSESEAFRTLRAALDFSGGGARRLTISSTEPSDGKTTIISNLSVAFAQSGKKTLLIDGDMRRPGLTRLFERGGHSGLSTVLRDTRPIVDSVVGIIFETELENLHVMPAGPRPVNPVELLTNDRLSDLLGWAESNYDQVLIDAPPSLAVTDAAIIGRLVDGAILTVRPDKNRRKLVLRASEALTSLGCELLGLVINSVQPRTDHEYGYNYGYGYGHGEYGHGEEDEHETETIPIAGKSTKTADTGSTIGISRDSSARRARRRPAA